MADETNGQSQVEATAEEENAEDAKNLEDETKKSDQTEMKQDESVQLSMSSDSGSWDEETKERFETAVFTLATFAAVVAVYIYIVYNLSSPPTVLHRI
ncbi:hypothetical protein ANTPLA_LOCUS5487 [Anthophora plagiata]